MMSIDAIRPARGAPALGGSAADVLLFGLRTGAAVVPVMLEAAIDSLPDQGDDANIGISSARRKRDLLPPNRRLTRAAYAGSLRARCTRAIGAAARGSSRSPRRSAARFAR